MRSLVDRSDSPLVPPGRKSNGVHEQASVARQSVEGDCSFIEYAITVEEPESLLEAVTETDDAHFNITYRSASGLPRNLPVKRYDGEPLSRSDLQHNFLSYLFDDTHRVFRNPRPGLKGPPKSTTWRCAVPIYPQGMAKGCTRRSDETEEELREYEARVSKYEDTPFVDGEGVVKEEEVKDPETGVIDTKAMPNTLRQRQGCPPPGNAMLTFKELFIESLLQSGKCTRAMREKMVADENFAEDFAKVCLLVNAGRINTTLACEWWSKRRALKALRLARLCANAPCPFHCPLVVYPEMKTILRSYHPLPALQRSENTRRHLQDAPRMKSLLKSVLLDGEKPGLPGSGTATGALAAKNAKSAAADGESEEAPGDIGELVRRHLKRPNKPPTSAVTVLFLFMAHSNEITTLHFEHPHDIFTLFFPHPDISVPSKQRARAFLWLMWHYLEGGVLLPPGSHPNPYDDDHSRESTQRAREAWDSLSEKDQGKINAQGYWKGIKNPAFIEYKKQRASRGSAPTAASQDSSEAGSAGEEAPPEYLHRVLCPKLNTITHQQSATENTDTAFEKEWGLQMREERRKFLIRFQEEEQAKAQEGRNGAQRADREGEGGAGGGSSSGARGPGGKHKGKEKGSKKRSVVAGGGSSYPLANILAAASAEKAAAAAASATQQSSSRGGEGDGEGSGRRRKKRQRNGSAYDEPSDDEDQDVTRPDKGDRLWELDLSLPAQLAPRSGVLRHDDTVGEREGSNKARQLPPAPLSHSLPRLAWRRILERAQRGVGDASYESDDEDVAIDEARDERPRAELARILACLREVRTHRGELKRSTGAAQGVEGADVGEAIE